jgi:hypothetical protein
MRRLTENAAVHQMIRQTPTGANTVGAEQEWWCPECGRRLLMSFPPAYRRVVLEVGDVWTPHVAGNGGIAVSPIAPGDDGSHTWTDDDDRALRDWRDGLGGDGASG